MAEKTSYAPGEPCWVELASPDVEAAEVFYGGLFGWDCASPGPQYGGYTTFTLGGTPGTEVAGLLKAADPAQPSDWICYFSVADADATAELVRAAGGRVRVPPMDVMDLGRMAVFTDALGAGFGVWEPAAFAGARRVDEPGTLLWTELACRDVETARTFYRTVFGWEFTEEQEGGFSYTEWLLEGRSVAGMVRMDHRWPDDATPYWIPYFAVDNCDATADKGRALGGSVRVPPTDIPPGRFALMADPCGAHFMVFTPKD
ncbi:VOC family protein [Thermomonospora amylolytica]|uniref:VOC family protein n=1 Tax=Thermomonospora amylolytica TaxID=1411117 RepID=UPI000E6CC4A7|nr:VOC family protein [Thermomonospora amylolytica]